MPELDAVWVRRMQAGDLSAFDALFEKYRRGIMAYVSAMLADRSKAEDIVQETFVELVQNIGSIDPGRNLSGWLYRVARNRAIDAMRHRKFEVLPGEEAVRDRLDRERGAGGLDGGGDRAADEDRLARVQAALGRLPEGERELLALRFQGGLKFREMAALLERPLGTVLWQVQDCIGKLKKLVDFEETK